MSGTAGLPGVSAIVVVRNGERRLARALASIRDQAPPVDEILVIDGGSTDGTAAVAAAFAGVHFMPQQGSGLAAARNTGIAAAAATVIAFLDHDDVWTADKLAVQLPMLAALPAPAYAIAQLRLVPDQGAALPPGHRGERRDAPRLGRTPGTLIAHTALFARIPFDESLASGCDMDWFVRAAEQGVPCAVADAVLLEKTVHADSLSADTARNRDQAFRVIAGARRRRREGGPPRG